MKSEEHWNKLLHDDAGNVDRYREEFLAMGDKVRFLLGAYDHQKNAMGSLQARSKALGSRAHRASVVVRCVTRYLAEKLSMDVRAVYSFLGVLSKFDDAAIADIMEGRKI